MSVAASYSETDLEYVPAALDDLEVTEPGEGTTRCIGSGNGTALRAASSFSILALRISSYILTALSSFFGGIEGG